MVNTPPPTAPLPLLAVEGLHVAYGGIKAVKGIDLQVNAGELVCLIGSNGAGKTSTLNALAGLIPATAKHAQLLQQPLLGLPIHQRLPLGLALVPEGRGVFTRMSVQENLLLGAYWRGHSKAIQREVQDDLERMWQLFPRLCERQRQTAGTLSGGEQQMLAMARALMGKPKLLLLDEPSMGLAPIMVERIFEVIGQVHAQGIGVLLVEQNANMALRIANRGYVLSSGLIELHGLAQDLANSPQVQAAYLGEQLG